MRGIALWLVSSRSPLWDRYPGQCDFSQKRSHKPLRDGTRPRSLLVLKWRMSSFSLAYLTCLPGAVSLILSPFLFPCRPSFLRFFPVTSFIRLCILPTFLPSYVSTSPCFSSPFSYSLLPPFLLPVPSFPLY